MLCWGIWILSQSFLTFPGKGRTTLKHHYLGRNSHQLGYILSISSGSCPAPYTIHLAIGVGPWLRWTKTHMASGPKGLKYLSWEYRYQETPALVYLVSRVNMWVGISSRVN